MAGYGTFGEGDITSPRLTPSYVQDAFKTITLSLAPYVPFSQRYTMELHKVQGTEGSVVKTDTPSFFNITPTEVGYDEEWNTAVGDYLARNEISQHDFGELVPNVNHLLTPMAQKLTALLDAMPGEAKMHQKKMKSTNIGELVGEHAQEFMRDVLTAGGVDVGSSPMGVSEELLNRGPSGEGFDIIRTDEQEPFFQGMSTILTKIDMDRVVAAETTDSELSKEISSTIKKGMNPEEAQAKMEKQISNIYGRINKVMRDIIESIPITERTEMSTEELLRYAHGHPDFASGAIPAAVGLPRQFADRFIGLAAQKAVTPDKDTYLYALPLGDTGWLANLQIEMILDGGIPQIKWITEYVAGGDSQYYFMNLGLAVQRELAITDAIFNEKTMATIEMAAINDYYASKASMDAVDWAMVSTVENALSPDAHVDMKKLYKGQIGAQGASRLTSSDIASMLAAQFKSFQEDSSNPGEKFAEAWKEIFAESNEATGLWKKNVISKYGKALQDYKKGITDPTKQGVWSANTNETWHPVKNPKYGVNVSMAPIISAQAGQSVSRITSSGEYKKKRARITDPDFGVTAGTKVKSQASFIDYKDEYETMAPKKAHLASFL